MKQAPTLIKAVPRFLLAILFALYMVPAGVLAQEIPEDELIVDFTNCMTGCRDFEGEIGCEVLCGCTMERFRSVLTRETYVALKTEMDNEVLSPENRSFLDETALMCVAEMDQVLEDLGLRVPEELVLPPPEEGDGEEGEGG